MRRIFQLVGILAALLLLAGCVSTAEGNGNLPWSAPANWEDQSLGIPF